MMHVIFRDALEDRDYLARYAVGEAELRARAAEWTPERAAARHRACRPRRSSDWPASTRPRGRAAIRLNYGLNRHAGGGMAVRTIACLPALTGAWRDTGGGVLLSTSGAFPVDEPRCSGPTSRRRARARST